MRITVLHGNALEEAEALAERICYRIQPDRVDHQHDRTRVGDQHRPGRPGAVRVYSLDTPQIETNPPSSLLVPRWVFSSHLQTITMPIEGGNFIKRFLFILILVI